MSSTLYTVGTALRRAQDSGLRVSVLVQSHWLRGVVVALDGHGVMLDLDEDDEHSVVRLESISAVRVQGSVPHPPTEETYESAQPLPAYGALQPA
ncbi:MAG: hypothetical protein QM747_09220 [Nocardioides sp.]